MGTGTVDGRTLRYRHRRRELLGAAVEYVLDHGIVDISLRAMATELGVTHATLLRHFSTKDELLAEVIDRVHADFVGALDADPALAAAHSAEELLRAVWRHMCTPREQRQFVLLYELVARATRRPEASGDLRRSIVDDWVGTLAQRLERDGEEAGRARTLATLAVGTVRGLQLDLLLTGNRERVDLAFEEVVRTLSR